MPQYLFMLGRKPEISAQEIKSVFKDSKILAQTSNYLRLETKQTFNAPQSIAKLGGTIKIGAVLGEFASQEIPLFLSDFLSKKYPEQSKIKYGISGIDLPPQDLKIFLNEIKKQLSEQGKKSRFINKNLLNPSLPVLWEEGFFKGKGSEFLIIFSENNFLIAETEAAQNINQYSLRDYQKPFRDARTGMLPPKLAQILINLAELQQGQTLWDPFCGSGTLLMEGLLMGLNVIGSDQEVKAVNGSQQNLWWLCERFHLPRNYQIFQQDVLQPFKPKFKIDAVVCEGYLGTPKTRLPEANILMKEIAFLEKFYFKFLTNLKNSLAPNTSIIICLPYFKTPQKAFFLPNILTKIKALGYAISALSSTERQTLLYDRKDQIVGREILKVVFNKI